MPKLPVVSGEQMIGLLERKGYHVVRTRGSHVRLYPSDQLPHAKKVTVPLHKTLKTGTLRAIMRDSGLTIDDLSGR